MPQHPIRIAVQLQPQHTTWAHIRDTVVELEQLGVDVLFNWDHFYPLSGPADGEHFESWTALAAWAELTSRVEFGALVNCNSYRNADLQADMARTIDHISAKGGTGRFIFGTGSGWFERDYDEYGYEFGTPGTRIAALGEALTRIEERWPKLNPQPTRKIPVLIGGKGEKKTLRLVAQHADIWHSFLSVDEQIRLNGVLAEHAAAVGRDVSEIELSTELNSRLSPRTDEDAEGLLGAGVTLFTIGLSGPEYDVSVVKRWLDWRDARNA